MLLAKKIIAVYVLNFICVYDNLNPFIFFIKRLALTLNKIKISNIV